MSDTPFSSFFSPCPPANPFNLAQPFTMDGAPSAPLFSTFGPSAYPHSEFFPLLRPFTSPTQVLGSFSPFTSFPTRTTQLPPPPAFASLTSTCPPLSLLHLLGCPLPFSQPPHPFSSPALFLNSPHGSPSQSLVPPLFAPLVAQPAPLQAEQTADESPSKRPKTRGPYKKSQRPTKRGPYKTSNRPKTRGPYAPKLPAPLFVPEDQPAASARLLAVPAPFVSLEDQDKRPATVPLFPTEDQPTAPRSLVFSPFVPPEDQKNGRTVPAARRGQYKKSSAPKHRPVQPALLFVPPEDQQQEDENEANVFPSMPASELDSTARYRQKLRKTK
jgi:hypothetical protein